MIQSLEYHYRKLVEDMAQIMACLTKMIENGYGSILYLLRVP